MRPLLLSTLALASLLTGCTLGDPTTSASTEAIIASSSTMSARDRLDAPVITAVRLAGGRATVTWRKVADAKGYQLVSCDSGALPTIEKTNAQDTVHTFTALVPGASYGVKIRARKVTGLAAGDANNSKFCECRTFVGVEPVATILLAPATAQLMVGGSRQMTATLLDRTGAVLGDRDLVWATSAPAVATVSPDGLVLAVGAGVASVTVSSEGVTASAVFTVLEPVASITLSPATAQLDVGQSQQFSATLRDRFGAVLSGRVVTWASSVPGVAAVSSTGLVSALASGHTVVSAVSEGVSGAASVTVAVPVADMDLIADEVLDPVQHIVTFKADGSQRRIITNGVHPTWVGNLVLARGPYQDNRIFAMNPDGSNRRLILGAGPSYVPDLSPDAGRLTLVYGDCGGQHRIAIANADGSGLRLLGPCGAIPRWSPDGSRVVFTAGGDIYSIRPDGTELRRIAAGTSAFAVAYSPDGSALVFDSYASGRGRLMVMNADGSNVRALLAPAVGASDELPDWSPDGRWIAFRSSRSGKHEIWRARVDGTGLMQITSTVLPQGLVRWRR